MRKDKNWLATIDVDVAENGPRKRITSPKPADGNEPATEGPAACRGAAAGVKTAPSSTQTLRQSALYIHWRQKGAVPSLLQTVHQIFCMKYLKCHRDYNEDIGHEEEKSREDCKISNLECGRQRGVVKSLQNEALESPARRIRSRERG